MERIYVGEAIANPPLEYSLQAASLFLFKKSAG
jgi:hypothetical protein